MYGRPHFDPMGWVQWPGHLKFSFEFMRLLGSAQEGAATVSECFLAASRINPNDDESWYREWRRTADMSAERGRKAHASGNSLTAQGNWLRAISYYGAAVSTLDVTDDRRRDVLAMRRACTEHFLELQKPAGEFIEIPSLNDYPLEGYFLHARTDAAKSPVVICAGEPGRPKEEFLCQTARHALGRGISLLAIDLPGADTSPGAASGAGRENLEVAINSIIQYLKAREDVDDSRIAALLDGVCSSSLIGAIAEDHRLAAVAFNIAGVDLHEKPSPMAGRPDARRASVARHRNARNLSCPVLITIGEQGPLDTRHVLELSAQLRANESAVTLRIFEARETGASQGHVDNPTLANEFVFDWIARSLADSRVIRRPEKAAI